jgi:hypothetical protein
LGEALGEIEECGLLAFFRIETTFDQLDALA